MNGAWMLRRWLPAGALVSVLFLATVAAASKDDDVPEDHLAASALRIQVLDDDWNAPVSNIQALLHSTARQIHRHFPAGQWPAIQVYRSQRSPITIHQRGEEGQVRIGLTPQGMYWAQHAFQFGHELVHLLAGHLRTENRHANSWFEEALCEAGSLFVLRAMHRDWETNAPYSNWTDWRHNLAAYAKERMDADEHCLPEGQDFTAWYRDHEELLLSRASHQGGITVIVAKQLLPVFEEYPSGWQAVQYLRSGTVAPHGPLPQLLPAWHAACPDHLRAFVVQVARALGTEICVEQCVGTERAGAEVVLASDGQPRLPVVIGADASKRVRAAAEDLARYLGSISGTEFQVEVGDGSAGIAVGVRSDFPALDLPEEFVPEDPMRREEYLLRTHPRGAWLIGATDLAVEHVVWDFLHRLGYRQFFPGDKWEVIPSSPELRTSMDCLARPAYHARRIWYGHGPLPSRIEGHRQWSTRNRVTQGFRLHSSHYYEAIIAANREAFAAHPEYFAVVGGQRRTTGGDIKFCSSNPGLRRLVVDHAVRQMQANPDRDSISMDPSDGGNWCECQACARMGSISDRVLILANAVAEAINQLDLGDKYVGIYAYGFHSPPPAVEVHPHVIVSATAGFLRGGYTLDQVIRGWQAQGAVMGIYDYFSVMPWDGDMPGRARAARPSYMAETIPEFYAMNVRFHDAESSDNWGPNGLGYYVASRILWDLGEAERLDDIVDDFLQRAFGPARKPLTEFYQLIDGANRPLLSRNLVGRMYRSLAEGRRLATGDQAAVGRIDDLILYTRYVELKLQGQQLDALRHGHRIKDTGMVHYRAMWPWRHAHGIQLETVPDAWNQDQPHETAEIVAMLESGIQANPLVGFTPAAFSQNLVPATSLNLPEVPTGTLGDLYHGHGRQGGFDLFTWFDEPGEMTLKVTGGLIPHYRDRGAVKIGLFSPQEVTLQAVARDESVLPDGQERTVTLRTPYDGLHRIELRDGGDASRIFWDEGQPLVLPCLPGSSPPVRGAWSLYFYVPKGTQTVAGYIDHASGRFLDADGNQVLTLTDVVVPGYFSAPVKEGQDGQLWRVDRSRAQLLLMTVPPYLARNEKELLVPEEVVQRDRDK